MKKLLLLWLLIAPGQVLLSQVLPPNLPSNGLVAWFPFNSNANDLSGNSNNGIVNGATLTNDRFGNPNSAYEFNVIESITGSSSSFPAGNAARSISFWYNAQNLGTGCCKQILGYGGGSCGQSFNINFENIDIGTENIGKYEVQGHCLAFRTYTSYPTPANNTWHHIVVTYDQAVLRFYNDGVLVYTSPTVTLNTVVLSKIFSLGSEVNESGTAPYTHAIWPGFTGKLDDIAVYNRALNSNEVIQLYSMIDTVPGIPTAGLYAWYPFNGNANDESGNGNNGTVYNASLIGNRFGVANSAYSFDGVDDYIQTNNGGPTGTGITVSYWYQSVQNSQNNQVLSFGGDNWGSFFELYHNHWASQTTGPCYGPALSGGGTLVSNGFNTLPNTQIWHHVVVILPVNAADLNSAIFYFDGVKLTNTCSFANYGAPPPNIGIANSIRFGRGWQTGSWATYFNGKLDDVAIYNRALSQTEVLQLYYVKQAQSISFNSLTAKTYGDASFALSATSNSGLNVSYTSSDPNVATISGDIVTVIGAGNTIITASQAGSDIYGSAQSVQQTLTVSKAALMAIADNKSKVYNDVNPPLTISYSGFKNNEAVSVLDTKPIANTTATQISFVGTYEIEVSGGTDNNYDFNYVKGELSITGLAQTITFTTLNDIVETTGTFTLIGTASSGLPVVFSTTNIDKTSINGSVVTIISPGSITITAKQDGNNKYQAADPVSRTMCILPEKPTITAAGLGTSGVILTSSSATNNFWYKNSTTLSGANKSTYAVDGEGLYTVNVVIDGCASEFSDPYSIIITGINDMEQSLRLTLFPNPASNEIKIILSGVKQYENSEMIVFDLSGRLLTRQVMQGNEATLLIEHYSAGKYIIKITNKAFLINTRFIKY